MVHRFIVGLLMSIALHSKSNNESYLVQFNLFVCLFEGLPGYRGKSGKHRRW